MRRPHPALERPDSRCRMTGAIPPAQLSLRLPKHAKQPHLFHENSYKTTTPDAAAPVFLNWHQNGRLTSLRIVMVRNILRAHPTLVPKRGCVSAPVTVPRIGAFAAGLVCKGFSATMRDSPGVMPTACPAHPIRTATPRREVGGRLPARPAGATVSPRRSAGGSRSAALKPHADLYKYLSQKHRFRSPHRRTSSARCIVDMKSR